MAQLKRSSLHYAVLVAILLVGLGLRFWQLDAKPLWLDEVISALFSTGHRYADVPLQVFFPLSQLDRLFTVQSGVSCAQIAQRVATDSVHPPVFFCLLYAWMEALQPWTANWVWVLRSLPALFGVLGIVALYGLNRVAFSPQAGLVGAALMAVSPFAVYLAQEARHYTLPMLLITLALLGLVQIQQDLLTVNRFRPWVWFGWSAVNILGLYTHYFCAIALVAQLLALLGWILLQRRKLTGQQWGAIALAVGLIVLCYLPWLPTFLEHFSRPETDWLIPYRITWQRRLAPLYQTIVNWILMVIALPVENQPDRVVIPLALLMLGFSIWFIWQVRKGCRYLWQLPTHRPAIQLLSGFILGVLLQFFAIVYLLNKDLTLVPRYNFIIYPAICALLGASLSATPSIGERNSPLRPILLASLLSSLFVVNGLVFLKSYSPDRVAAQMAFEPEKSLITVMSYESLQEVALGLSFALELKKLYPPETIDAQVQYGFFDRSENYGEVWRSLRELEQPLSMPLNLWVVASPGMRTDDYPDQLRVQDPNAVRRALCPVDPAEFYRIGFPYQLFRCESQRGVRSEE
ncbi:glycosyltransferase family 39 protein [Egbenema bharatensis]|uniref:glycosyltransferase family 39 protein n=1 Tax=Egbenema bharatensis TaxID=3463334 RepID=UPI003A853388